MELGINRGEGISPDAKVFMLDDTTVVLQNGGNVSKTQQNINIASTQNQPGISAKSAQTQRAINRKLILVQSSIYKLSERYQDDINQMLEQIQDTPEGKERNRLINQTYKQFTHRIWVLRGQKERAKIARAHRPDTMSDTEFLKKWQHLVNKMQSRDFQKRFGAWAKYRKSLPNKVTRYTGASNTTVRRVIDIMYRKRQEMIRMYSIGAIALVVLLVIVMFVERNNDRMQANNTDTDNDNTPQPDKAQSPEPYPTQTIYHVVVGSFTDSAKAYRVAALYNDKVLQSGEKYRIVSYTTNRRAAADSVASIYTGWVLAQNEE